MTRLGSTRCVALSGLIAISLAAPGAAVETRVLSEAADGMRFQLEIVVPTPLRIEETVDGVAVSRFVVDGYRPEGSPGAPQLFVGTRLMAVPPGGRASLRLVDADIADYGVVVVAPQPSLRARYPDGTRDPSAAMPEEVVSFDPVAFAADGARNEPIRLGEPARLRHQDVVPVEVRPLLYDPSTQRLRVVRRLLVEVTLSPGVLPTNDPLQAAQAELVTSPAWERAYAQLLVNPVAAKNWRRVPERVIAKGGPLRNGLLRPGMLQEDEWKLRVPSTGPLRVNAASLLAAGFPAGTPVSRLRLVAKYFDPDDPLVPEVAEVPLLVVDSNQDGDLDSNESFLFYAEMPRDDARRGEAAQRYSFDNVYWLSVVESGTPERMPVRSPLASTVPGPTSFQQELAYEEDKVINLWVYSDDADLYFTNGLVAAGFESRYAVAIPGRANSSDVRVTVEAQQDWLRRPFTAFCDIAGMPRVPLGSHPGYEPSLTVGPPLSIVTGVVPAASIGSASTLTAGMMAEPGGHGFDDLTPFLDRVLVEYTASYVASGDRLRFTSGGASGPLRYSISDFSGAPLRAFDITDPKLPATFDLNGALAGGTLTLTDQVPPGGEHVYLVLADASVPVLAATRVTRDTNTSGDLLGDLSDLPLGSYDVLVVAHDDFVGSESLNRWVAFRQSQGHRVRVASTSDIYDAFNGGLLHYEAIAALARAAYANWGTTHLMLVGDGSEDAAGVLPTSGRNLVPARVRYFAVQASGGNGGWEHRNDMNDRYYAQMGTDYFPDFLLGRLPVSNLRELDNVINKTLLYEQPLPDDDGRWRKRLVHMSDDEWLRRQVPGLPGIAHTRGCSEWNFYRSVRRACETVRGAFPGDLECVPYYLHTISDSLWTHGELLHAPYDIDANPFPPCSDEGYKASHGSGGLEVSFYQGYAARALIDSIGGTTPGGTVFNDGGCLVFALQAHAAYNVVTDEQLIQTRDPFLPDLQNYGKPFVFFGFGCHLNEYGRPGEDGNFFSGDALGELYLTTARRGAVASYASTGFEYLSPNNVLHELMWRVFFEKRFSRAAGGGAVDSDTLSARWQLSELLQIAEASYGDRNIIDRYVLLGDPLLRLDAGVPRFQVTEIRNGFLRDGNRVGAIDPSQPVGFMLRVNDEQGIDSLWVERRFASGPPEPVPGVTITANIDTLPQIRFSRSYTLEFEVDFDRCDFDLVVGARDLAGRVSEFVGRGLFEKELLANGVPVQDGDTVDGRTAFRFKILGCAPLPSPLPLVVRVDDNVVATQIEPDSLNVNWNVDFISNLSPGRHQLAFEFDGATLLDLEVQVGGFALFDVVPFPNPFADVTRFYFHLEAPVARGTLRIMDLNGRTVRQLDLQTDGRVARNRQDGGIDVVGYDPGVVGSAIGWNFVEWNGTDRAGDEVANGVYLWELRLEDGGGRALRKRDKIVVMR